MDITKIKSVVCLSNHARIRVEEKPLILPETGEMLIRVHRSLISPGTELRSLRNRLAEEYKDEENWREFGYQNAGVVEDANCCAGFRNGDRVACVGVGYARHSNWAVVPQHLVWKLPDTISFEEGAFATLLGTALWATRRSDIVFGSHIAVVGLGLVGQLVCQISQLSGAHAIAIDRVEMRKQKALELGAEAVTEFDSDNIEAWKQKYTHGYGIDVGVVAFGGDASDALTQLAAVIKKAPDTHQYGKIVIVGGASVNATFPAAFGNIDICSSSRIGPGYHDKAWERGGEYPQALIPWNTRRNVEECFHAIATKKLQVAPLITHRVTINEVPSVCEKLVEHPDEALGVIVRYEH